MFFHTQPTYLQHPTNDQTKKSNETKSKELTSVQTCEKGKPTSLDSMCEF